MKILSKRKSRGFFGFHVMRMLMVSGGVAARKGFCFDGNYLVGILGSSCAIDVCNYALALTARK